MTSFISTISTFKRLDLSQSQQATGMNEKSFQFFGIKFGRAQTVACAMVETPSPMEPWRELRGLEKVHMRSIYRVLGFSPRFPLFLYHLFLELFILSHQLVLLVAFSFQLRTGLARDYIILKYIYHYRQYGS